MSVHAADIPRKFDSKLERDFWFHLAAEREAGRIREFWYHPVSFDIGGRIDEKGAKRARYTPDFMLMRNDGELCFLETKGFMREHARLRLLAAAKLYPFRFSLVRRMNGQWEIKDVEP